MEERVKGAFKLFLVFVFVLQNKPVSLDGAVPSIPAPWREGREREPTLGISPALRSFPHFPLINLIFIPNAYEKCKQLFKKYYTNLNI